ncbi:hypothetical protein FD951_19615 [Pseudomonas chlororaphis subsp. aurantiaca]|nr:hypothetical protein FD951_19615 [Pseudomonas chlororaphis subsp. aurantiaca]
MLSLPQGAQDLKIAKAFGLVAACGSGYRWRSRV